MIDVVIVAGSEIVFSTHGDTYPPGARYSNGTPNVGGLDLAFRTGHFVPDPKLYWADTSFLVVERSDFDGSNPVDIVATGLSFPRALDLIPVPEPGSLPGLIAGSGLLVLLGRMRRRS